MYSSSQDCDNETTFCPPDVCLATSQFNIDFISETASLQIVAPTRHSDIIMIKFYDPDTSCEKQAEVSSDPILITVTTTATDLTDFDLLVSSNHYFQGLQCRMVLVVNFFVFLKFIIFWLYCCYM